MQRALKLVAAVLAAERSALGLRLTKDPAGDADASSSPVVVERKQRQVMYNFQDVQYYSYITIGGQAITGLLDTGSFDLVVFDHSCIACGKAGKYASKDSPTFRPGTLKQSLYYGSGGVDVQEGFDTVAIGPFGDVNLSFWNGVSASMPVLGSAAFNSIIGVGPPETSGSDAWDAVAQSVKSVQHRLDENAYFPSNATGKRILKNTELAFELATQPTLIRAEGTTRFSVCLGQKPGSVGYFIWNDTGFLENPSMYVHIKVLGKHTWTVNMTDMRVSGHGVVGCKNGCGTIIDSGTSFLLMPYSAISKLRQLLQASNADCNDLSTLPKLTFKLDGKDFTLPADAYIARMSGSMASPAFPNLEAQRVSLKVGQDCELAVMGSGSYTNWGPLWILGMPFFRTYYTSFELGRNHDERGVYVAAASQDCTAAPLDGNLVSERATARTHLRSFNRSNVFIPRMAHRAMTESFISDL